MNSFEMPKRDYNKDTPATAAEKAYVAQLLIEKFAISLDEEDVAKYQIITHDEKPMTVKVSRACHRSIILLSKAGGRVLRPQNVEFDRTRYRVSYPGSSNYANANFIATSTGATEKPIQAEHVTIEVFDDGTITAPNDPDLLTSIYNDVYFSRSASPQETE